MAKKLGCGSLAGIMIVLLILLLVGSNEAIGYYFEHCDEDIAPNSDLMDCLMGGLEEPEPEGAVTATGTYEYKGYSVNITMNIPLEGGNVTGSVSGTCEGSIRGANGSGVSGKFSGTCDPFFVKIPASGDWSGSVNKAGKTVPIQFTGGGGGLSHQGSTTLSY